MNELRRATRVDREEAAKRAAVDEQTLLLERALRGGDLQAAAEHWASIAELWTWRYARPSLLALKERLPIVQALGDEDQVAWTLVRIGEEYRDGGHTAKCLAYWRLAQEYQPMSTQVREKVAGISLDGLRSFLGEKAFQRAWRRSETFLRWLRFPWRTDTLPSLEMACRLLGEAGSFPSFWQAQARGVGTGADGQHGWSEALLLAQQEVAARGEQNGDLRQGLLLANIGCAYDRLGYSHESKAHLEQALELFKRLGCATYEFMTLCNLGTVEIKYRHFLDLPFLLHFELGLDRAAELQDERSLAELLWKKGRADREDEYYQDACRNLDDACARYYELGDDTATFQVARELIWTSMEMGHHQKALEVGGQALSLLHERGGSGGTEEGLLLNLLAMLHAAAGAFSQAELTFRQAKALIQETEDRRLLAHTCIHTGFLFHWQGKSAFAAESLREGLALLPDEQGEREQLIRRLLERIVKETRE